MQFVRYDLCGVRLMSDGAVRFQEVLRKAAERRKRKRECRLDYWVECRACGHKEPNGFPYRCAKCNCDVRSRTETPDDGIITIYREERVE